MRELLRSKACGSGWKCPGRDEASYRPGRVAHAEWPRQCQNIRSARTQQYAEPPKHRPRIGVLIDSLSRCERPNSPRFGERKSPPAPRRQFAWPVPCYPSSRSIRCPAPSVRPDDEKTGGLPPLHVAPIPGCYSAVRRGLSSQRPLTPTSLDWYSGTSRRGPSR